jgi:hypothetical protein
MKTIPVLYISKWVEFRKSSSRNEVSHHVSFTLDDNSGEYKRENELFYASFKTFPFEMDFKKMQREVSGIKHKFLQKIAPLKSVLEKNAFRTPIRILFNEKSYTEGGICFGEVSAGKYFEKTDEVRMKAPLSLEEITFFTTVFLELSNSDYGS